MGRRWTVKLPRATVARDCEFSRFFFSPKFNPKPAYLRCPPSVPSVPSVPSDASGRCTRMLTGRWPKRRAERVATRVVLMHAFWTLLRCPRRIRACSGAILASSKNPCERHHWHHLHTECTSPKPQPSSSALAHTSPKTTDRPTSSHPRYITFLVIRSTLQP